MSLEAESVYCCLQRVTKCTQRIESGNPRGTLGNRILWKSFEELVGSDKVHLFTKDDSICTSCHIKIGELDPIIRDLKRKITSRGSISSKKSSKLCPNEAVVDSVEMDSGIKGTNSSHAGFTAESEHQYAINETSTAAPISVDQISEQSASRQDPKISLATSGENQMIARPVRKGSALVVLVGITSVSASQSRCFVCLRKSERCRIKKSALLDLWMNSQILVPRNNRVCKAHVVNGYFTPGAIEQIRSSHLKPDAELTGFEVAWWVIQLSKFKLQKEARERLSVIEALADASENHGEDLN